MSRPLRQQRQWRTTTVSSIGPSIRWRQLRAGEFTRDRGIVKREGLGADNLPGFMPFAGDDQEILAGKFGNSCRDRFATVADLYGAGGRLEDDPPDRGGRLGSRVVVGDVNAVRQAGCHLSH